MRPAFLGALVIAALVALVVSLAGNDDSEPSSSGSSAPSASPGTTTGPSAPLGHISPSSASGAVDLVRTGKGTLLHVNVKRLPPPPKGGYVVWLYNSITDARDLGGSLRGTFTLQAALPGDYRRYRFVDISARAGGRQPQPQRPERAANAAAAVRAGRSYPPRISTAISETSVGVRPTRTPLASSASALAAAVPAEPDTMAPAWPIVLPGGAVKPAM